MALALAWSVQGANWLDQMDFLVPVALFAVIAGSLLGMLRGSIVWALPIGALIGTGVVLWTVGGEYYPALDQAGRLLALRTEFIDWLIVVLGTGYPPQMTPYAIGLGALMFATVFAAAFAVYRHHRVLDAIVLLGAALIVNMSAILTDLFYQLLLFVVAATLLWLRAALVDRQDGWQRRRVNETLEVPTAIMRTGIISAGAAIGLAWLLMAVAVAAPLTDAWRSMDGVWTGVQDQFDSVFGSLTNPQSRISGNSFGSSFIVQGEWVSVDEEVLVLAAPRALYLRTRDLRHLHRAWLGLVRERAADRRGGSAPVQRAHVRALDGPRRRRGRADRDRDAPADRPRPVHRGISVGDLCAGDRLRAIRPAAPRAHPARECARRGGVLPAGRAALDRHRGRARRRRRRLPRGGPRPLPGRVPGDRSGARISRCR